MTKNQTKQVAMIEIYIANNMIDTAARSLSSLIRSAMTKTSKSELIKLAQELNLINNSEFIV
jgi:hypothetical protein